MSHIVRDIMTAANHSTVRVLNHVGTYYKVHRQVQKWARKESNCKSLLGEFPKPILEQILKDLNVQSKP